MLRQNLDFSFSRLFGDITGGASGYLSANPDGAILSKVQSGLLDILPPVSQPVADEITRAVAALALTVASRFLFALLDKWKANRSARKARKNSDEK